MAQIHDADEDHNTFRIPEDNYIEIHAGLLKKIGEERVKIMRLHKDLSNYKTIQNFLTLVCLSSFPVTCTN